MYEHIASCLTAERAESALAWRLDINRTGGFRVLPMGSSVPVVLPKSPPASSSDRYTILAAYLCDDSPGLVPKSIESATRTMMLKNVCRAVSKLHGEGALDMSPREEDGGRCMCLLTDAEFQY